MIIKILLKGSAKKISKSEIKWVIIIPCSLLIYINQKIIHLINLKIPNFNMIKLKNSQIDSLVLHTLSSRTTKDSNKLSKGNKDLLDL